MPKILIGGRPAEPEERTRSSMQMQKFAEERGWMARIGYSQFQEDDKTFKSGAKAGQTVEGKIIDNVWCQGLKDGHVFTVVWENNKLYHVMYDNQITTLKELKEKL